MEEFPVMIVEHADEEVFKQSCKEWVEKGYKVSSTSCGFINSEEYDYCDWYQAILIKEEKV